MVERHWTGIAKTNKAENYIEHLTEKTFPGLALLTGFIEARILRRPVEDGVEFLVITVWESVDAIRQFAGEKAEVANVPPEARTMMVRFDEFARHYEVVGRGD